MGSVEKESMVKVVYFNQWFSSITPIIRDIKKRRGWRTSGPVDIRIIASSRNSEHVYKKVVDEFYVEDWVEAADEAESKKNYVDWVLEICRKEHVDLFFVKKHARWILERTDEFKGIGVDIVSESLDAIAGVSDKSEVYKRLQRESGIRKYIPNYIVNDSVESAYEAMEEIAKLGGDWGDLGCCLKLVEDEGGMSYRRIKNIKENDISSLRQYGGNVISSGNAVSMFANAKLNTLMLMEYLEGPEISVDCYIVDGDLHTVCRSKGESRVERIYSSVELYAVCCKIMEVFGFKTAFNVQFRHHEDGGLRLLEINPRLSGGAYLLLPLQLNIVDNILADRLGLEQKGCMDLYAGKEYSVTHYEEAVIL